MDSIPKLSQRALAIAVAAAICPAVTAAQSAGQIEFAVGNVSALDARRFPRVANKGLQINAGDTVITGEGARAQIRFSDGGYVSLQPNTRFKIDEYGYGGRADGSEKGFFSLIKGGLRAVTGAIGKVNRTSYQVSTPVATIGIRGTHYKLRLCENDCFDAGRLLANGLYASVGEGQIALANRVGSLQLPQGRAAFVASADTPPVPTDKSVQVPPARMQKVAMILEYKQELLAGEQRDAEGLPTLLKDATRVIKPAAGSIVANNNPSQAFNIAVLDGLGRLIGYQNAPIGPEIKHETTALVDTGATEFLAWGRWTNGKTSPNASGLPLVFSGDQSLHYVVTGQPTPDPFFTSALGITLTYSFKAGTRATSDSGVMGAGATGGTLVLNLFSAAATLSLNNFTVDFGNQTFTMNQTNAPISSANFTLSPTTVSSGTACASGCTTTISGIFAGAKAEQAGLTYDINNFTGDNVKGAAVFAQ